MEAQLVRQAQAGGNSDTAVASALIAMHMRNRDKVIPDTAGSSDDLASMVKLAQRGCHKDLEQDLPDLRDVQEVATPSEESRFEFASKAGVVGSLADTVSALLCCKREYTQPARKGDPSETDSLQYDKEGSLKDIDPKQDQYDYLNGVFIMDPRFLVFEFVSPFMLRCVELNVPYMTSIMCCS